MSAPRRKPPRRRSFLRAGLGFWCAIAIGLLLIAYIGVLEASRPHVSGDKLRLDGFFTLVQDGRIKDATILDQDGYVVGDYQADDGTIQAYNLPYFKSEGTREQLASTLVGNNVPTRVDQQFAKGLVGPATILLPALILVVIFIYFIMAWRSGTGLFGVRSGARRVTVEEADVGFADVAGQDEAVEELREVSDFLADPDRFASLGAQVPKGILLFGPPGCGKTLMARALAGEAGAAFYSISGADFVELYVGVGAARVRDLFKNARENAPAIIFIDEIDAVGRRRVGGGPPGGTGASSEEQNQALNALLAEIDGFSPTQGVIVIGASNRPDVLDPALLRPGRFDRAVGLALPNERGRLEILEVHARSKALDSTVDLESISRRAVGMTGADLASIMNEAALRAGREHKRQLSQTHLDEALTRVREAPERQRRLSLRDRRVGQALLTDERVTFHDVAGADDAIEELREVREYLADPARFEELGARIPNGYLIAGPPGSGKTLLARAVAGEANAAFVSASATEFVEVYVGEGAARVRDLFAQARATAPAIVFIDELDSIGSQRGVAITDHSERQQTLNQLLVELDGFGQRSGVIAMAATNRPDILDRALTRPGRFDRTIELDLPDREARLAILELHARDKRLASDADLNSLAALTRGLSGAELSAIMNESALLAGRRGRQDITGELLEESLERVGLGIGRSRRLTDEERKMVAYHEAGHGLVARALPGGRVLHKISIVGRGGYLGTTWQSEDDDRLVHSRSLLIERMATFLGGRAAEQLVFGELGDGAASDLAVVGSIARRMVAQLGMSEALGAINYPDESNGRAPYSEETSRLIDEEARKLVAEAEQLADGVLQDSREALDRVASALLERETLTIEEVEEIAGPPPQVRRGTGARR